MTREELYKKASELPLSSGVYIMKNAEGEVIYVGKSKKLRNRVSQYFSKIPHSIKTEKMVNAVRDFDYILTQSENEALILENIQIKKYLPKYNILLKDDKNYPYIKLTAEKYPRITVTRRRNGAGEYFGPYSTIGSAGRLADLVGKLFALPTCKKSFPKDIGKERPCLNYHIGRCVGICTGKISSEDYAKIIDDVRAFLKGHQEKVIRSLEGKMAKASEDLEFEKAAAYRDSIKDIKVLRERQRVQGDGEKNADYVALYEGEHGSAITLATVREGCFGDKISYRFASDTVVDGESFCSVLYDLYEKRADIPPKIFTNVDVSEDEKGALENCLSEKAGRKVSFSKAKIGANKQLCDMVLANAAEYIRAYNEKSRREGKTLALLAKLLLLEVYPERIESYDVSNWGDDFISTGMIVIDQGTFNKKAYRSFNAKENGSQNDSACMAEALKRRLERALAGDEGFLPMPDLILADGGEIQVNALKSVLSELSLEIPVFGMVKDRHHKTRTLTDGEREISIAKDGEIFSFIYKIQEEVHRYSLSRMDKRRRESLRHSSLENLNGIGKVKANALRAHFGSLAALKNATPEELTAVKGISPKIAESIYKQLHEV